MWTVPAASTAARHHMPRSPFVPPSSFCTSYVPEPTAFLQGLESICREQGILFVADEVQTGFGRTGTMFCVEQHGIRPDVVVMAKGLASGFPISAVGASAELMARWPTGSHGGTYGGNPIGCAAATATLDIITAPGFLDGVRARGQQLTEGLRELRESCLVIRSLGDSLL